MITKSILPMKFITKVIYWQHFNRWTGFTFTNLDVHLLEKKIRVVSGFLSYFQDGN